MQQHLETTSFFRTIGDAFVSFRSVAFHDDAQTLHRWMNEAHVYPFWHLNVPLESYEQHLQRMLSDSHQQLWIGSVDSNEISYFESYWVKGDVVENVYEAHPYDQGVHLLIGPPDALGRGHIYPLLFTMLKQQFRVVETEKIIAEPDIRNEKMIHVFEKCGFQPVKEVELPDKKALLMFCRRDTFERRWNEWNSMNV
ncbi:GNAT family N-acetyltransferase [Priestia koreensis]|uniref:GNAT family N-acetyltransferase n=1 Tax=Priestia koreensis TaxID=284581 RepID=UPI001F5A0ACD|nr:GNAT family N-acetyltransferase [Priestia koreensis]UNL83509.1 acetyltransferase [Priestia koreensis]